MSRPVDAEENTRRRYESPAIGSAIRRQVESLTARCEEGDTEALEELGAIAAHLERATFEGARSMYRKGYTWAAIGDALGVTRQAASARFRES